MKEADIMRSVQVSLSLLGARVFRNNVGLFEDKNGDKIRVGLCNGSSDLIGWTHDGRFLAVEIKRKETKLKGLQKNFVDKVNSAGGVGFCAWSAESATKQYTERTELNGKKS